MDRNEKLYFEDFDKKSLSEIRNLFENLKNIGMSEDLIDKYAFEYKKFFENRSAALSSDKVYNTSIPWRKDLMTTNVSETDPVPTGLSPSVASKPAS